MEPIDVILYPLIPILIILHLFAAPYTKVEESFNLQAVHDITAFGIPFSNISSTLRQNYDHFDFPGAVPRTFVGALGMSSLSYGLNRLAGFAGRQYGQVIARGFLGAFNTAALLSYSSRVAEAFGKDVGRWYILLQASQFHVIYYASRTLPNMFAFYFTTYALSNFLPSARPLKKVAIEKKYQTAISLLVFCGIVFRSEIAILLFTQSLYLLAMKRISLTVLIKTGIASALVSLAIPVPIDSYFWQRPIWPELAGFYYNAILGKSADWGVSSFHYYFTSGLPRLLVNPFALCMVPLSLYLPATRKFSRDLVLPLLAFIAMYSIQPHKEARFIIYTVPAFTATASLSASYIWTRRSKSFLYLIGSVLLVLSIIGSFAVSGGMLLISSLNYPGGEALSSLHRSLDKTVWPAESSGNETIKIHMDVLSCMTGVTRFQERPWRNLSPEHLPVINKRPVQFVYDKTEDPNELLRPEFWDQFDYLLMEDPGKAIGAWEVIETVFAYAGIEFLRPGDGSSFSENLERVYAANNVTGTSDDPPSSEDVKHAAEDGTPTIDEQFKSKDEDFATIKARLLLQELGTFGTYKLVRDAVRQVTGGWWVGPRMEPRIRIMKKVQNPMSL